MPEFVNEPLWDFSLPIHRHAMQSALDDVRSRLGQRYGMVINGSVRHSEETLDRYNPAWPEQLIGTSAMASHADVDEAVRVASQAQKTWGAESLANRVGLLRRIAQGLRNERAELAAWVLFECGKPWREADAEVAEAIDFCEYYASCAELLEGPAGLNVPGEENRFDFLPRGPAAILAPWNFPLAILCGMATAAFSARRAATRDAVLAVKEDW